MSKIFCTFVVEIKKTNYGFYNRAKQFGMYNFCAI